jgi:hypothetical protein
VVDSTERTLLIGLFKVFLPGCDGQTLDELASEQTELEDLDSVSGQKVDQVVLQIEGESQVLDRDAGDVSSWRQWSVPRVLTTEKPCFVIKKSPCFVATTSSASLNPSFFQS